MPTRRSRRWTSPAPAARWLERLSAGWLRISRLGRRATYCEWAGSRGLRAALMYDRCDTTVEVAERAISVRLDEEATRALELLMREGKSRSEAIREAVVDTARRRLYEIAAADAARVGADEDDRREVAAVQALMEELSEER
jgi:Arc/MetJ-type ribon-helix-helix transcriptional regulator